MFHLREHQLARLAAIGGLVAGCFIGLDAFTAHAADPVAINSPAELWQGFDPEALPLEVESLERWTEEDTVFEKLRFTSEEIEGGKVRVFAIAGIAHAGAARPGILHIHGGGQTASLDWVRFWTKRGYACVTFDYCGAWDNRTEVTDWGPLRHGNMAHAAGGHQVSPTPRNSSWYHWTVAARRALTLLASQPSVDPQRLGIFGISMGGTLCWSVAGSDDRVKTAVPIYGCGYNVDEQRTRWGFPKLSPELALFQRAVSPEAHAPYVTCPVLFLNATNDFHGWMDRSYDTLGATPGAHWQAYTPRQNHHIAAPQGRNLPAWMDYQLRGGPAFPTSPTIQMAIGTSGVPEVLVDLHGASAEQVDVYYSLGDKPAPNRFWRSAESRPHNLQFRAETPVVNAWEPLAVFANVRYASGLCLTTNLLVRVPGTLGKARATLTAGTPLADQQLAESWFYARSHTDPMIERTYVLVEIVNGRPLAATMNPDVFGEQIPIDLTSHVIGDPQFAAPGGGRLAFDFDGELGDEGLRVTLTEHDWTPHAKTYQATVPADNSADGWQTVELDLDDFRRKDSEASLSQWDEVDKINLQGSTTQSRPFRISNLRWVPRSQP